MVVGCLTIVGSLNELAQSRRISVNPFARTLGACNRDPWPAGSGSCRRRIPKFVLGSRDLRLPGLGSYLQTASNAGDTGAIISGLTVMIGVIVLIDQMFWHPIIAWSDKFKFEQVEASETTRSPVLELLRRSRLAGTNQTDGNYAVAGSGDIALRACSRPASSRSS